MSDESTRGCWLLVEYDLEHEPDLHGPFTQDERDSQLGEALYMHGKETPCVMLDLVGGKLTAWRPSYQLRTEVLDKMEKADQASELTDDNATRMWSNDNPPKEIRALRALHLDMLFEEGRDEE